MVIVLSLCWSIFTYISILPLREEWDCAVNIDGNVADDFNPPTPRGVGLQCRKRLPNLHQFQSSHSARSGTAKVHNFFTVP